MAAKFHLPDFTRKFHLNMMLKKMLDEFPDAFYDGVTIGSMYGEFPSSIWNGGRCLGGMMREHDIHYVIDALKKEDISLRFTYTNPLIREEHLSNAHCNNCLRLADRADRKNGVILTSPLLEAYVRKNYPNYRIISSTCKQITDLGLLCEELEKYDWVVLDYNLNNNWDLLEKLPHKEKCELLVNAVCVPGCTRRKAHYEFLGQIQIDYIEHLQKHGPNVPFKQKGSFPCAYPQNMIYETTGYSTHIKPQDIYERLVPMGFENFKIEGRSNNLLNVLETYMYYMVKPERRDEIRLFYLLSLQESGVISVND
ncbi:MAG: hypothetical protein IK130_00590 [Oscillospiraceae bacterium]|nr:hypothetical protein [Oscillospiraceae bacterium]